MVDSGLYKVTERERKAVSDWLRDTFERMFDTVLEPFIQEKEETQKPEEPERRPSSFGQFFATWWGIGVLTGVVVALWVLAGLAFLVEPWWLTLTRLVLTCALLGGATNQLAIHLLFRPKKPWPPWSPIKLQGLLYKYHERLATKIGEAVHNHLLNEENVRQYLKEELSEGRKRVLRSRVEEAIRGFGSALDSEAGREAVATAVKFIGEQIVKNKKAIRAIIEKIIEYLNKEIEKSNILLKAAVGIWKLFGGDLEGKVRAAVEEILGNMDKFVKDIKGRIFKKIGDTLAETEGVDKFVDWVVRWLPWAAAKAASKIPIKDMVRRAVLRYDLEKFEKSVIKAVAGQELRFIVYLGWMAGAFVGFVTGGLRLGLNL